MIHQGNIFNIGSTVREMRCVRVNHDPKNLYPVGSRVLVNADDYNIKKGGGLIIRHDMMPSLLFGDIDTGNKIKTYGMFPNRHGYTIFCKNSIDVENLTLVDGKRLYNLHYIKPVKKFHIEDMKGIRNYVDRWGAITLKFLDHTEASDFVFRLKFIFGLYKYSCTFGSNFIHTDPGFFKIGPCNMYVTFMDIHYCVPIWHPKKVDGMGILISVISDDGPESMSGTLMSFTTSIVLTNYVENVFKVDGCVANPQERMGSDLTKPILSIIEMAKQYENYDAGKHGKAKAKKKKKASKDPSELNKYGTFSGCNTTSNSTATTYYYNTTTK